MCQIRYEEYLGPTLVAVKEGWTADNGLGVALRKTG